MKFTKWIQLVAFGFLSGCSSQYLPSSNLDTSASPTENTTVTPEKSIKNQTPASASQTDKTNTAVLTKSTQVANKSLPNTWDLSGGIAAKGNRKSWTASINWLQSGAGAYQIRLNGPLGSGSVLIQKKGGNVSFKDGAKVVTARNADQLLMEQTGIRLPVGNLYYWVRGIPAPGAVQQASRDRSNHLVNLRQAGYNIAYGGYRSYNGTDLPTQIRLQGNGVFIKLNISRWQF